MSTYQTLLSPPSLANIPSQTIEIKNKKPHQLMNRNDRFGTYINYGFGQPFSYWKDYDEYEYCAPKYKNLKEELLNNAIYRLPLDRFTDLYKKGEEIYDRIGRILGQPRVDGAEIDRNTPFARAVTHWNEYCGIKYDTKISFNHLFSILLYTDLSALPSKMKVVCRKIRVTETKHDVKKRHHEFVNWLKLMSETIIFYGNNLSHRDSPIYHGLSDRFFFQQFKSQFYIPTSTTTDRGQAINFARSGDDGIVLELGGLESIGAPYFDCMEISAFPHEREYLFFRGELNIKSVTIAHQIFSMAPLSLYQSIVNGSIIIDKMLIISKFTPMYAMWSNVVISRPIAY